MEVAARLQAEGYDVRGIRPPTVPPGTARLRISLTLNANVALVSGLARSLEEVLR
jgi:8-amino-7-oxononanoate synthase